MADDELLSQDQIDGLSDGDFGADLDLGDDGTGGGVSGDSLKPASDLLSSQASNVLATVLNKQIDISEQKTGAASKDDLGSTYGSEALLLTVNFSQGVSGALYLVFLKADIAILADLMMMGDGTSGYEEDHKDAIAELTNQIMGAVVSNGGAEFGTSFSTETPAVSEFDAGSLPFNPEECQAVDFSMEIEDIKKTNFTAVFSAELAESFSALGASASGDNSGGDSGGAGELDTGGLDLESFDSDSSVGGQTAAAPSGGAMMKGGTIFGTTGNPKIDMLLDVDLEVSIELGRSHMSIKRIIELGPGSIIELDRMAGEPVDLLVNGKVVAKGEVVVIDENFGIRIISLVSPEERLKSL